MPDALSRGANSLAGLDLTLGSDRASVVLNRPQACNAIDAEMVASLHRRSSFCWMCSRRSGFAAIFPERTRERRLRANVCAWNGRYRPMIPMLRRNSRLTVDGDRPRHAAISRTPRPAFTRSAIWTRSSSDRNRAESTGSRVCTSGEYLYSRPVFGSLTVHPFRHLLPVLRPIPRIRQISELFNPCRVNST